MGCQPFDQVLVERARNGDAVARAELAEQIGNWSYAVARARQVQSDRWYIEADDVLQEVCVKVDQHLAEYDGGSFAAWVRTIIENSLRDAIRKANRQKEDRGKTVSIDEPVSGARPDTDGKMKIIDTLVAPDTDDCTGGASSVDGDAELDRSAKLRMLLDEFIKNCENKTHARILQLRYFDDRKHREIADDLGIPPSTVSVCLMRMEQRFGAWAAKYYPELM